MQVLELTLGAEQKRSDGNYGSDGRSAFVKLAVHPGDRLEDVIRHGQQVLRDALAPAGPRQLYVLVKGTRAGDERAQDLKRLGLAYSPSNKGWAGHVPEDQIDGLVEHVQRLGLEVHVEKVENADPTAGGA